MKLDVYTDGSNTYNGYEYSYGGYGWVLVLNEQNEQTLLKGGGSMPVNLSKPVTNNRAEILAIITALEYIDQNEFYFDEPIDLFSDSLICVNCINKKWKIKKNMDLFARYFSVQKKLLDKGMKLNVQWIKGHVGHQFNEMADQLAGEYAELVREKKPVGHVEYMECIEL